MRKLTTQIFCGVLVLCSLLCTMASAISINLVYPGANLFSATHDPAAKAAINAAAVDLSAAITNNLAAINNDVYVGTNGNASVTYNWKYVYENPQIEGAEVTIENATIAANTVTMYVGARSLLGDTLGEGGPAVLNLDPAYSWVSPSQLPGAAASAQSQSTIAYKRGNGPIIDTLTGSSVVGGQTLNVSVDYGVAYGSLSLDWDGNDNGAKDTDTQLNSYWHFNHTTPVATGKNDIYSVALHEMLHVLGIGASNSWDAKQSGTNWSGSNVIALAGSGSNLVDPLFSHIAEDTMSTRAFDGVAQEVVMDPTITEGTRKNLTALDLAFLRDIGYSTITSVMPSFSPADFNQDGDVDSADLLTWRNSYGVNANGDTDNDGDSDGRDFLLWQREYTGPLPFTAVVSVPEPSGFVLLSIGTISLLGLRRRSG